MLDSLLSTLSPFSDIERIGDRYYLEGSNIYSTDFNKVREQIVWHSIVWSDTEYRGSFMNRRIRYLNASHIGFDAALITLALPRVSSGRTLLPMQLIGAAGFIAEVACRYFQPPSYNLYRLLIGTAQVIGSASIGTGVRLAFESYLETGRLYPM